MKTTPQPTPAQTKKEIELYQKQDQALDSPKAQRLTEEEKETLRNYFQAQITNRMRGLNSFIKQAAEAAGIEVEFETVLA